MKNLRTLLVVASLVYIIASILLLLNEEAVLNSMNLLKVMDYFKYWVILSVVLLAGLILVGSIYLNQLKRSVGKLDKEHTATKARIYDMEEARRREEAENEQRIEAFQQSLEKHRKPSDDANN
jgi:hypothetical protein